MRGLFVNSGQTYFKICDKNEFCSAISQDFESETYIFLAHRKQPPEIHWLPARKVKRPSKSSSEVGENCKVMNHSHSKLMACEWHCIFLYNGYWHVDLFNFITFKRKHKYQWNTVKVIREIPVERWNDSIDHCVTRIIKWLEKQFPWA